MIRKLEKEEREDEDVETKEPEADEGEEHLDKNKKTSGKKTKGKKGKKNGLPVVAFTFSRNRCNDNADKLSNLDLTTAEEKHHIHIFMEKCISRLKDQDKKLPQVK